MKIQLVVGSYKKMIGLARYTECLCQAMDEAGIAYSLAQPSHPLFVKAAHRLLRPLGFDLETFFGIYPLSASRLDHGALTHLTAQQMALLLWSRPRLGPTVVTVHDIVPFLVREDKEQSTFRHRADRLFDELAMKGLNRANMLISVSEYTKETVVNALTVPAGKIKVIYEGVRHDIFRSMAVDDDFYQRYGLDRHLRYLLYVGSENPRKNLSRLLEAFAEVHRALPDTRLVKVGSVEYAPQAGRLRQRVSDLGLQDAVLFVEHVSDVDLARFYNLADLFVFPSLYEGFGLPPLEAMACGTPVVCSNAASLPEVVGDAALTVDPHDVEALAEAMQRVLADEDLAADLRRRGLERAAGFTWERTARETVAVYEEVLGGGEGGGG